MNLERLREPFPREAVHWRAQGTPTEKNGKFVAMALAYLDARDVMDRLDDVCGPGGWQAEFTETPKGRVLCRLGIHTPNGWVWKSDGAGDTDVEGEKGGISDALKRAAVHWGIGRYLYRLDSPWLECEAKKAQNGKVYWKRWTQDPWSKVREGGYQPTLPPEEPAAPASDPRPLIERAGPMPSAQEPVPPRDPAKVAASLMRLVGMATTKDELDHTLARPKFDEAWEWTSLESPKHAALIKEAVEAARERIEAASRAPLSPQIEDAMNDDLRGVL